MQESHVKPPMLQEGIPRTASYAPYSCHTRTCKKCGSSVHEPTVKCLRHGLQMPKDLGFGARCRLGRLKWDDYAE